jgi:predicted dehydrogenase
MIIRTIAAIGLGHRQHEAIRSMLAAACGNLRLIGYADVRQDASGMRKLREQGIDAGTWFPSHHVLLAEARPDIVMIGSPTKLHLSHIQDALSAGCEVIVEAPIVTTPEETWKVARLIARYGAHRIHVGGVLRSSPLYRRIAALLESDAIGMPVSMEANELRSFITLDWFPLGRWGRSHILENCCQILDIFNAIARGSRAVRVASFGGRETLGPGAYEYGGMAATHGRTGKGRIIDHQVAMVEYTNGFRLGFHTNTNCPRPQRRLMIVGTAGWIECDMAVGRISWRQNFTLPTEERIGDNDLAHGSDYRAMGSDIAASLLAGRPFTVPPSAALEAGLLAMAIDQACNEGRVVELAPWWRQLDEALGGQSG